DEARRPRGPARVSCRPHSSEDVRHREQPRRRTCRTVNAERAAASRAFEDAILRFEAALSKIETALSGPPSAEDAAHIDALAALEDASPLMKRQQAFNRAIVNEIRHQRAHQRAVIELIRCQTS